MITKTLASIYSIMKLNPTHAMTPEPSVPQIPRCDTVISRFAVLWWRHRAAILLMMGILLVVLPFISWNFVGTGYYLVATAFGLVCIREAIRLIRLRDNKY